MAMAYGMENGESATLRVPDHSFCPSHSTDRAVHLWAWENAITRKTTKSLKKRKKKKARKKEKISLEINFHILKIQKKIYIINQ